MQVSRVSSCQKVSVWLDVAKSGEKISSMNLSMTLDNESCEALGHAAGQQKL